MIPRSSRSHSTLVPADSITASTPQVGHPLASPGDDREAPARTLPFEGGSLLAEVEVEHATGAEGDLGQARTNAALADQARLLVTHQGRDGRGTVERRGRPEQARAVHHLGEGGGRDAQGRQHVIVPVRGVSPEEAGDSGVGGVGDVEGALGEVPGQPGVDRADAQVPRAVGVGLVEQPGRLGGGGVGRHPDAVGLEHQTGPHRAQVLPTRGPGPPAPRWRGPTRWWTPAGW